jgi:hypothetical protein
MSDTVLTFLSGLISMGFAITALFFLKFWRDTGDRLFLMFAAAFALFAIEQAGLGLGIGGEDSISAYLLRLAAFCAIVLGIGLKNTKGAGREP